MVEVLVEKRSLWGGELEHEEGLDGSLLGRREVPDGSGFGNGSHLSEGKVCCRAGFVAFWWNVAVETSKRKLSFN